MATAKQSLQLLRVAALLAAIFASGIVIGRFTSPEPAPVVINPAPPSDAVNRATRIMARNFEFDAETEERFHTLMERMEKEMRPFDPGTSGRRDVWRRFLPEIRSFVPDHLKDKHDAQIRRTERRFERMVRQRESNNGG